MITNKMKLKLLQMFLNKNVIMCYVIRGVFMLEVNNLV